MGIGPYWVGDIPTTTLSVEATRGGASVDLATFDAAEVMLVAPDGSSITLAAVITSSEIVLDWPQPSVLTLPGAYTLIPLLTTSAGAREVLDPLPFLVTALPVAGEWLPAAAVLALTGTPVTPAQVAAAQAVISLVSGRDLDDLSRFSFADARHLRFAVAWQAVHMSLNPTAMGSLPATSKAVGDVSVSYDTAAGPQWLAPLARIALRKVSWRGNRTVRIGRLADKVSLVSLLEDADPETGWTPLTSGA